MRLIATFTNLTHAREFSSFLKSENIDNVLESIDNHYDLWVVNEDNMAKALHWHAQFSGAPDNSQFQGHWDKEQRSKQFAPTSPTKKPKGKLTLLLLGLIIALFATAIFQTQQAPITASPIYVSLMFDAPPALRTASKLQREYTVKELEDPKKYLTPQDLKILTSTESSYWKGFYGMIVDRFSDKPAQKVPPLFQDISHGEVWRLITPAFLHVDFFHLLFNAIWLLILGNQIERRIKVLRFSLLILISGLLSNTSQYLMGGPLFFGLSGVICALLGFIWVRQKRAPWEGYLLNRATLLFLLVFIFAMAGLQFVAFVFQIMGKDFFQTGLANTAHIVGGLVGALLARFDFLATKKS